MMDILAESAVRVTLVGGGVALVLGILRIRSPRLLHRTWTTVVLVMLLMPVVVVWGPELAVPLLPPHTTSTMIAPAAGDIPAAQSDKIPMTPASASDHAQGRMTWTAAVAMVYFVGMGLFLVRLAIGVRRTRAIRRNAIQDQGRLTHPACATPMTIGVVAPAIILPPDWACWDEAELSAVLTHEEEHVRRRDPLVAFVALVNRAIFWFHPLAWWLQREIARLSEQACDAVVISRGHDSDVYSTCLLRFARRAIDAGGRVAPVALTMPGAGLQERLRMLARSQAPHPSSSRLACAAVACGVLVILCAATAPTAAPGQNVPSSTRSQGALSIQLSEHFEIFHDGLPIDRVNDAVRDAEAAYTQLSAVLKYDMPRRVPIVLVPRDRDLSDTGGPARDLVLQGGGGPTGQRVLISLESLDRRTGILVHELTHQFAFEIVPDTSRDVPVLIEGLAEHQRGAWAADDLRMMRDAAAAAAIPSVATLVDADRHWAHAVFDFVAERRGEEGVRQLLFVLRARTTLVQAVPMAFGVTLDQFDQAFRGYVAVRFGQP